MEELTSGLVLADRYELRTDLGGGGQSDVWLAHDTDTDAAVAIKIVAPKDGSSFDLAVERLRNEAYIGLNIDHPGIVKCLAFVEESSPPFLVMEYFASRNLATVVEEDGLVHDEGQLAEIGAMIASALQRVHGAEPDPIIHRDVKPANVLIGSDHSGGTVAKLSDFGVARVPRTGPRLTETGQHPGDREFASPEQLSGAPDLTDRSDVWSLCSTLEWAATGKAVEQHQEYMTRLRSGLSAILARGLVVSPPRERLSAARLKNALEEYAALCTERPVAANGMLDGASILGPEAEPRVRSWAARARPAAPRSRLTKLTTHAAQPVAPRASGRGVRRYLVAKWFSADRLSRFLFDLSVLLVTSGLLRLIFAAFIGLPSTDPTTEGFADTLALMSAIVAVRQLEARPLREARDLKREFAQEPLLGRLVENDRELTPLATLPLIAAFITARDAETLELLRAMRSPKGLRAHPEVMESIFRIILRHARGPYIGIDSNEPLEYVGNWSWFFAVHELRDNRADDVRISLVPESIVVGGPYDSDAERRDAHDKYVAWHFDNDVELRWRDPELAPLPTELTQSPKAGIAFLPVEHSAWLFEPATNEMTFLKWLIAGDPDYPLVEKFVEDMSRDSQLWEIESARTVDPQHAAHWEAYVNPSQRLYARDAVYPGFLVDRLGELDPGRPPVILDAAAGICADSVFLLENGYSVWANEVDRMMTEIGQTYVAGHGHVEPQRSELRWQDLGSLPGRIPFDVVLVAGNSLCQVLDDAQRRLCVEQFYKVLNPGGILIVDERNFRYMHPFNAAGEEEPGKFLQELHARDFMYRGRVVRGYPSFIGEDEVSWRLFRVRPDLAAEELEEMTSDEYSELLGRITRDDIDNWKIGEKDFRLHRFGYSDLHDLLHACEFESIRTFADFDEVASGAMPEREKIENATFLTYVATKGRGVEIGRRARPREA